MAIRYHSTLQAFQNLFRRALSADYDHKSHEYRHCDRRNRADYDHDPDMLENSYIFQPTSLVIATYESLARVSI